MAEGPEQQPPAEVRFQAEQATVTADAVELRGGVRVAAGRWQLRADRLRLRGLGGATLEAEGPLSVWPCACAGARLSLSVDQASLALRGGQVEALTVRGAAVRVGPVPVLYLPWFQLRSERSVGLTPPRVALRAGDGWLLGAGVHAPLPGASWLSVSPGLYLRGGHEVLLRARLAEGSLEGRWDQRPAGALWAARGQGAAAPREGAVAWSIDARRGPRARAATVEIDDAARAHDRARFAWMLPWAGTFSTGAWGSGLRGEGPWAAGPRASWHGSAADGAAAWSSDAGVIARGDGAASSLLRAGLDLERAGWWGALRWRASLRSQGALSSRPDDAVVEGAAMPAAAVELPLVREGAAAATLAPGLGLRALASGQRGQGEPWLIGAMPARAAMAAGRARVAWSWASGAVVDLRGEAGAVSDGASTAPAARLLLAAEREAQRLWFDGAASSEGATLAAGASAALGAAQLDARLDQQRGPGALALRRLEGSWLRGWLDRPGWSGEAGASAPLGPWLRAGARLWAADGAALAGYGELILTDRCGCLRLGLHGARRQGREGLDLWASLALL